MAKLSEETRLGLLKEANGLLARAKVARVGAGKEGKLEEWVMEAEEEAAEIVKGVVNGLRVTAREAGLDALGVCWMGFEHMMWRRDYVGAATLLWPSHVFDARPREVEIIFKAMDKGGAYVSVMGAGGLGKSFCCAVRLFMEWAHDAAATRVDLVSKNQEKIKKLFSDFVGLHRKAALVMPGAVEAETISTDKVGGWGIFLNLIRQGDESSSVLKGSHEKSREAEHPIYGHRTARYVMIDEAQDVPPGVFDDVGNILSSVRGDDGAGGARRMRQIVLTANPSLPNSRYGEHNRPEGGWGALPGGEENAQEWRAKLGAWCVRLDALKSKNVREKRDIYPGMVTWAGVQQQLTLCDGNENHPIWWTYVRGMFPPEGALATLIPQRWLTAAEGEWIFENEAVAFAGVDVARLGGDSPAMCIMRVGRAVGWRDFSGQEFKMGSASWRVQIDNVFTLPGGDTQEVADDVMRRLRDAGISPENVAVDITGSAGVFDLMVHQWREKVGGARYEAASAVPVPWHEWAEESEKRLPDGGVPVIPVNYSSRPSEARIALEDSVTPRDSYTNKATELWFALAKYFEMGYVRYGRSIGRRVLDELGSRKAGKAVGKGRKQGVEPKEAHKRRLSGASPDLADCTTLALNAARMSMPELRPKAKDTKDEAIGGNGARAIPLSSGEACSMTDEGGGFVPLTIENVMRTHERANNGGYAPSGQSDFLRLG
jgi:hypothetical protein